jgi:hypothetical protein
MADMLLPVSTVVEIWFLWLAGCCKSPSGILTGHCSLTISAAFTSLPRFIQRDLV